MSNILVREFILASNRSTYNVVQFFSYVIFGIMSMVSYEKMCVKLKFHCVYLFSNRNTYSLTEKNQLLNDCRNCFNFFPISHFWDIEYSFMRK